MRYRYENGTRYNISNRTYSIPQRDRLVKSFFVNNKAREGEMIVNGLITLENFAVVPVDREILALNDYSE